MQFRIKNEDIRKYNNTEGLELPKYTSQLINWANQNAQGTRPKFVGQLSELFPKFQKISSDISAENWEKWYLTYYPDAIEKATDKIYFQVNNLKKAIELIDKEMVEKWVRDLIIVKTYNGLYIQQAIFAYIAEKFGENYRLANPAEESSGIDGFIGNIPYSIKPISYKTMDRLSENIDVKIIYYTKAKNGLKIEIDNY